MRLLIVDDKAENRMLLAALFRGHHWHVDEADNGQRALELAREVLPDVLVTDLLMPVMDGYTLLHEWKRDPELSRIPAVVYTATYTDSRDEELARTMGADAFLQKPMEPERFLARIREVVTQQTLINHPPVNMPLTNDSELLQLYNRALVRRVEEKAIRLEELNRSLSASEQRLQAVLEHSPAGILLLDGEGRPRDPNPATLRLLGVTEAAALGNRDYASFVLPARREAFRAWLVQALAGGAGTLEHEILALDGRQRWLEAQAVSFRTDGEASQALLIVRDITGRKRAEDELRDAHACLKLAIEAGGVGLWDWNLQTGEVNYSREWHRQLGLEEGDIGSRIEDWRERLHPEDRPRVEAYLADRLAGDDPVYEVEFRLRHQDGSYRRILARAREVRDAGGLRLRLHGTHIDITERVALQEQFLQAQKMESVGRLASGVAHDFNNLLTVIDGTSELALMGLGTEDPLRADLEEVRRASARAAALTRQLLTFSRRKAVHLEVIDPAEVIANMTGMLQRLIGERIRLRIDARPGTGFVEIDSGQLEQVVMNLVVNARDAMPGGGALHIVLRPVDLDTDYADRHLDLGAGSYLLLEVGDTGCGMDEGTRQRIFEPFFTTKEHGRGTGLGLSTVFGIVRQIGGGVEVYSEPGQGTTFKIYLAQVTAAKPRPIAQVEVQSLSGHEPVLLVEDDADLARLTLRILETAGYEVRVASSAEEALALLDRKAFRPALLLCDVVLPGMDGVELGRRARELDPALKLLFTSGYTDEVLHLRDLDEEQAPFIGKPYAYLELARKVREVLDGGPV
jgi:two-component system, cell cycle sensor histidine kinase and response regulator CckA